MSALSLAAKREYYARLGNSLPPPVLDEPEYRQRRLTTAVETFEALRPGDAYEAQLAVQIVLCGAQAVENLREANVYRENFAKSMRCQAQAARMMREERATRRVLLQEQKVRLAVEAVAGRTSVPADGASAPALPIDARIEIQAALPRVQAAVAPPPLAPALPPPIPEPPAASPLHAAATQARTSATALPPPSPEAITMAEAFMEENLAIAAQIRHDGGVTPQNKAYFGRLTLPSDPALIDALVRGTSDLFTLLDEAGGVALEAAA